MAFPMNQTVHKAGSGTRQIGQSENPAGKRGDGDSTVFSELEQYFQCLCFRYFIERLESEIGLRKNMIAGMHC